MFTTALVLAAVGGLNWGLIALFDLNLVALLFGANTVLSNLTYLVVGIAAAYVLVAQIVRLSNESNADSRSSAQQNNRPAYSNR